MDRTRRFSWDDDCGSMVGPREAAALARRDGQTFEAYARDYSDNWPFETARPVDLIEGMVSAMHAADEARE